MSAVNQATAQPVKDVSIMLASCLAQVTVNVEKIKPVLAEHACWVVEAIVTAQVIKHVSIVNVRIHV